MPGKAKDRSFLFVKQNDDITLAILKAHNPKRDVQL